MVFFQKFEGIAPQSSSIALEKSKVTLMPEIIGLDISSTFTLLQGTKQALLVWKYMFFNFAEIS